MRWYCRYPLSYRDVRELLAERGIRVDAATIYRWVQRFGPEIRKSHQGNETFRGIKKGLFQNNEPGVLNEVAFVAGLVKNAA